MDSRLCAWRSHRQGLDGGLAGQSATEVLARTGWARSVGGVSPYLKLFSRAGLGRAAADEAVAKMLLQELPGPRGCTYVVPAPDYALALAAGQPFGMDEMKVARKLGVTDGEIDKLRAAVLTALKSGPLDPEALKKHVGEAARNLGSEGVKKGITTTLPVALGMLQSAGDIRRVSANGRLDQQRYRYAAWQPNPAASRAQSADDTFTELARKYFSWIGPASVAEFQAFSGLGVKAAKTAVEPLQLIAAGDGGMLLPEDEAAFRNFKPPKQPQYVLVSSLDNIHHLRRDIAGLLAPGDELSELLRTGRSVLELPGHAIFDRGRLVGLWEFDPETGTIAWASRIPVTKALEEAVAKMEAFVRDDLGDARSFSLDSPKSRAPRLAALRKAAHS